ncbi:hypothetical protein T07_1358 [Trichinella nelsoni]|uniref:Uncharacterized protein n=1 Tax=Trichinella nelsoni TaxID=6336 RepID=A0A0V0RMA1_9BILA|nr:hypothetical protein T07_1358 [Trichinella nelsoni]
MYGEVDIGCGWVLFYTVSTEPDCRFIFVDPGMLFESVITVMNMHPLRVLREGRPVVNFQPDRHAWTLIVLVKVR